MIYVLFYVIANAGTIAYLWYKESLNHYLTKIMLTVLLMSLVFSGNMINLYGFQFNVGIVFLINYLTIHNTIDTNIFVSGLYNLFVNGILVRYLILLLCVKPYSII